MINILFSMLGPAMEGEQLDYFQSFGQWTTLNERNDRLLFDAVAPVESIPAVQQALTAMGREPVIIGVWNPDGTPLVEYPLNTQAWLAVAPDLVDSTDPDNPVYSRPTAFSEVHRWAGWETKQG